MGGCWGKEILVQCCLCVSSRRWGPSGNTDALGCRVEELGPHLVSDGSREMLPCRILLCPLQHQGIRSGHRGCFEF